jgi:hypothetical protein
MKYHLLAASTAVLAFGAALSPPAFAHDTPNPDGHLAANVNYGFNVIGRDTLAGETDGLYTDVWSHKGYAYIGTFQEPTCSRAGVFIVDIGDAIDNYGGGLNDGAVVAEIKSAPNTRVNDVKVHTVTFQNKTRDVLILTEEKCGALNGKGTRQKGQGGISLYDVTDPAAPFAIKQHFLDTEIHNTYSWTPEDGNSYLLAVDDINLDDVIVVDITRPQSPKEVGRTGIGEWVGGSTFPEIADDGQLFTGVFAAPLLHDIWVDQIDGQWLAILSYWDAGFVLLDVTDPTNPIPIADSSYPDPDPVYGTSPAEGNGHAAVFGGDQGQYIWAGDEDFDPFRTQVTDANGDGHLATQGDNVPQIAPGGSISGEGRYVGLACAAIPAAADPTDIAIIQRGDCAFTTKAGAAEAAGYAAAVVFNHSTGCEGSVSMLVDAGIPALFVPRPDGMAIVGLGGAYDPDTCDGSGVDNGDALLTGYEETNVGTIAVGSDFDGWGYYYVLNNLPGGTTTLAPPAFPGQPPAERDVLQIGHLEHMGYFAPIELLDPALATGSGDLTMHNVEGDPLTAGDTPTFDAGPRSFVSWYSAGMRATEYRPGHWHTGNGDVQSWNVHEVGRFIAPDGSNFWGVHVDEHAGEQIILGSDRNTGLWIFSFTCESEVLVENEAGELVDSGLYCRRDLN